MKALLIASLMLASTACAPVQRQKEPPPIQAFESYSRSLSQGDLESAYKTLGPEYTAGMSFDAFKRLFERHGEAMKREANALLKTMASASPREEVWVTLGDQRVHLVRTQGGWKLTDTRNSKAPEVR